MNKEIDDLVERSRNSLEDASKAYDRALISYMRVLVFKDLKSLAVGDQDIPTPK